MTAAYGGDGSYTGSTSPGVSHQVNAANTATSITNAATLSSTASAVGSSYSVNVTVAASAPGSGTPSGTVNVSDGTGATCVVPLVSGAGSCSLVSTSIGAKTITATYVATPNFNTSTSAGVPHTVTTANTATALATS